MNSFRAAVQKEYGDFLRAWPKVFDKNKNNMCEYDEFCTALNKLDYTCQSRKLLWNLLLPEKGRTYLSLEDLDERAYRAHARGSVIVRDPMKHQTTQTSFMFRQRTHDGYQRHR